MRGAWLAMVILGCWLALFDFQPVRAQDEGAHPEHSSAPGEAHGSTDKDIFGKSLDLAIWTTVVFLVLLFVLNKYAWGPMLEGLQQREARIRNAIDEAQKAQEEAQRLREQFRLEMAQAEEKARAIQEEARRDAQRFRDEETAKTKADLQAERDRMYRELQTARDQALQQLWNQAAELATLISAKAIRRQLTPEDHRRLADEALAELNQAAAQRQLVRSAL
jgi:F-type H+-transporting ATPase subunit b